MALLSVIIPCYNEEETIRTFFSETETIRKKMQLDFEYLFINDGSQDQTLKILRNLHDTFPDCVHYLSLSRNFGKEAAVFAGLENVKGDFVAIMDADLQDPPELLLQMYEKIQDSDVDCVAAKRTNRHGESLIISTFSRIFYWIMNQISVVPMIDGVRDYRLISRKMVDAILQLSEYNRFSKGIFTWVGFHTEYLAYANHERIAGKTKWSFWSKVRYAVSGFVNFSEIPLNLATYMGFFVVLFDVLAIMILIIRHLIFNNSVSGWTSTLVIILFCFGLTMITLGVIGRYISNIFLETKKRPIYIVKEKDKK